MFHLEFNKTVAGFSDLLHLLLGEVEHPGPGCDGRHPAALLHHLHRVDGLDTRGGPRVKHLAPVLQTVAALLHLGPSGSVPHRGGVAVQT